MGQWQPGQSGNVAGRPKGSQNRSTGIRELLQPHAAEMIAKAVELAKGGDIAALRLCLERCVPALKSNDDPIELDGLGDDTAANATLIVRAMGRGELSPDQGSTMLAAMASHAKIIEAAQLERRIALLEEKANART